METWVCNVIDKPAMRLGSRYLQYMAWAVAINLVGLAHPGWAATGAAVEESVLFATVKEYAEAVAKSDSLEAGKRDFVCLFKMKQEDKLTDGSFPVDSDPVYDWCTQRREEAHKRAIQQRDRALDAIWPGKRTTSRLCGFPAFFYCGNWKSAVSPVLFCYASDCRTPA